MTAFTLTGTVVLEQPFTEVVEADTIEEARTKIRANFDDDPEKVVSFGEGLEVRTIEWEDIVTDPEELKDYDAVRARAEFRRAEEEKRKMEE